MASRVIVFIAAVSFLANVIAATSLNDINKFLVDKCPLPDFDCNLKAAKEMLSVEETKSCLLHGKSCERLRTLISLEKIDSNPSACNMQSRDILAANGEMVGNPQRKPKANFYTRLETLVLEAIKGHAYYCCRIHADNIRQAREQVDDDDKIKIANEVTSKMVYSRRHVVFPGIVQEDAKWAYPDFVKVVEEREPGAKFSALISDEVTGKLNKEKFTALYQKYVEEPCRTYVNNLKHVFEPALFDSFASCSNLGDALQQYKLCKEIAENKNSSKQLLKNMMAHASKPKSTGFADDD